MIIHGFGAIDSCGIKRRGYKSVGNRVKRNGDGLSLDSIASSANAEHLQRISFRIVGAGEQE
ncbi:MAG: hypothetical protein ACYDC1_23065, partial [Limisphaerales bacterium]